MTNVTAGRTRLAHALPFYYGWVIVANGVAVSLSTRTVMAVATLSVFVVPMTQSQGWSVGMFSGAVSLGGLVAVAGDDEEILIAHCDRAAIERTRRDWPFLRDRRVDAYEGLTKRSAE